MRISLITPSFNQAEYLGRTIDSVLAQEGNFELDYCVIDGASTDGSVELLQSYGNKIAWTSEKDDGQVDAINQGLVKAKGDIVGWLNSDDLLLPGALDAVAAAFESSDCDWVHGDCKIIDPNDKEIRSWISKYKRYHARRYNRRRLLMRNFVSQMTVFWRRELIDQVGLLDPSVSLAFDYDYWLRLSKLAAPIYLDQAIAAFRWYPASKSGANFREQFDQDRQIAIKHGPLTGLSMLQKKIHTHAIVSIYRLLSIGR